MKKFITVLISDKPKAFNITGNVHGLGGGLEIEIADDRNGEDLAKSTEDYLRWLQLQIKNWPQ